MNAPADLPVHDLPREAINNGAEIPVALIRPNPWNRKIDEKLLDDLAATVAKHGVLQPIVLRAAAGAKAGQPLYEIVAGERRWRAATQAGLATIPAIVKTLTDLEVVELMLIENLQREGLHELDEAEGYDRLLRKEAGLQGFASVDDLCKHFGKSRSYVFQRLKLLKLCDEAKKAFRTGDIDFSHARIVAPIADPKRQADAVKDIVRGWGGNRMSARDAQEHVARHFMLDLATAIFKTGDAQLLPEAGACTGCPKRSGANPDLFEGVKKGDICADPACYQRKEDAHRSAVKARAEAEGKQVITGAEAKKIKPHDYGSLKGYLELDKTHHQISSDNKPLRKLLGKALPEVKLLEDPHSGTLVEVVAEKDALALLKERGVIKQARLPSSSAGERDAVAKAREVTKYRTALAMECVRVAGEQPGAEIAYRQLLLQQLAVHVYTRLDHDNTKRACHLMGWSAPAGEATLKRVRTLTDGDMARFFTAALVAGDAHVSPYNANGKPKVLADLAAALGVDAEAMRQEMRREKLQRVPAKKAAAKKPAKAQPTPETALAGALKKAAAKKPVVKYIDEATGSTWSGRGLQPAWLKAALAQGRTLADFDATAKAGAKPAPKAHISAAAADVMGRLETP